ncbi:hypothetical protein [Hydrogenophaga sp.]|uniref:hypothetical protein n=1 Tax=Hydrogenophaga sp. TaxID=1904254 RepID=UPI0027156720|nr:hypothetical protein [Hydrogenophaga sp.]MDO9438229.1 hypothetical protein [Hydrogenophaga sp.]
MKSTAYAQPVTLSANHSSNFSGTGAPPSPTAQPASLPNQEGASLTDRLNAKARESWDMDAVVKAILKLKEKDQLPAFIDDALCQEAANVLLELGQIHLLCRLAELKPIAYVLDVGASEQKACTLGSIGVIWPVGTPVCVVLAASLSAKAAHALDAFLPYPTSVVLRVVADGVAESSEAEAQALEALVKGSGATALDVTDRSIYPHLAERLLACRGHWATVHMRLDSAPHELLAQTQRKIDRLELHPPEGAAILAPNVAFLRTLMEKGVRTLIVHGPLDVFKLATALQASAGLGELHLDRVEACFVVPRGADVGWTIASLSRSQMIGELQHQPMRLEMTGYTRLNAEAAQRLSSPGSLARMALRTAESAANRHRLTAESRRYDVSQRWFDAVTAIGGYLAPHQSLEALVGYVLSPANTLIPKDNWVSSANAFPVTKSLEDKLRWLVAVKTPDALLRAALTELLQGARPEEVDSVCQTLIFMRFPPLAQGPETWQALSRDFKARWLSDRVSRSELNAIAVPPDATPAVERPRIEHEVVEPRLPRGGIAELLIPSGEQARAALLVRFRQMPRDKVTKEIVRLLTTGRCNVAHMSTPQQMKFTTFLLQEGQWKLLAHLVPTRRMWSLDAATPAIAEAIEKMTPWPSSTSECHIVMPSSLSAACVSGLGKFAQSVPSKHLSLIIGFEPNPDALAWKDLATLVASNKGASLTLSLPSDAGFSAAGVIGFLNSISSAQLRVFGLVDVIEPSAPLQQALTAYCRNSAVPDISISMCSESLTQAVLTCRPWNRIIAPVSPTLAEVVLKGGVVADALTLERRGFDDLQEIEIIVKYTGGLKLLNVAGVPIDLERLAKLLDGKRSIEIVKAPLSTSGKQASALAVALIRQNASLRELDIVDWDPSDGDDYRWPLEKPTRDALSEITFRHTLRYSQAFSVGAGSGFGASLGNGALLGLANSPVFQRGVRPFIDPAKVIGSMLNASSAKALSLTSKAAYVAAHQAWETHIDALADLLAPSVTLAAVAAHLKTLGRTVVLKRVRGYEPDIGDTASDQLMNKVISMVMGGVPQTVVAESIARRLAHDSISTPLLLEALVIVGLMPSRQWLKDALGIELTDH